MDQSILENYLKCQIQDFEDIYEITRLKGGRSNPNYLLTTANKKYVLRSQPGGKLLKTAHDMGREFRILSALGSTNVPVPKVYHLCEDLSILGVSFFLMEYVSGNISQSFYLKDLTNGQRRTTYLNMTAELANLHKLDYQAIGLSDFGKEGNYFKRQYHRWNKAFKFSIPKGLPSFTKLSEFIESNVPQDAQRTIVHGDYRLDNLVFESKSRKVKAILDWELSTLGDPLSDLGYFLGVMSAPKDFFMSGFGGIDRSRIGIPEEEELLEFYCAKVGIKRIDNWPFYKAFGYFRLSAICAGIQARVIQGNAVDPASKLFGSMTGPLAEIGLAQIK